MNKKKIKNLALCGGGFFGYAEVGVLKEFEDNYGEYFDIDNICGVSVGSIIAALYTVGYDATELTKILFDLDFDMLIKDIQFTYWNFFSNYGMYNADKLEEEIERLIRIKTNIKFCTFSQTKKNLTIISTNLNYQCAKIFNRDDTPNMIISKAVRMSISYPIIITPVMFEGDLYGDGGEFVNYPIIMFDNLDETIGITFADHNENADGTLKNRIPINNMYDYVRSIGLTMSRSAYVSQITSKYLNRSIVVHIHENISSLQFNLSKEQKNFIYECGVNAARQQFGKIVGISEKIEKIENKLILKKPNHILNIDDIINIDYFDDNLKQNILSAAIRILRDNNNIENYGEFLKILKS